MARVRPLNEMTDKQLLEKAKGYGIYARVSKMLRSSGRSEAESVLADFMAHNPSLEKKNRQSHYDRIKAEHGTECQVCQKRPWTQICHLVQPDPNDVKSGKKENERIFRQSDFSKVEELLSRSFLGCNTCHVNWDCVWTKEHPRTFESLSQFSEVIRQRNEAGLKTRAAQKVSKRKERNWAEVDKLYNRKQCQCCQTIVDKTELAHIYGEYGKVESVSNISSHSIEKVINEAKKCVPLCKDCHNNYDKRYSETDSQNPHTFEEVCRDKIEEKGLGLEGHRQLDLWLDELNTRLSEVQWPSCELPIGYFGEPDLPPKCPSARNYLLGTKDPGYKKAKSQYNSERIKWRKRNEPGFREAENAKFRALVDRITAEDKWTNITGCNDHG